MKIELVVEIQKITVSKIILLWEINQYKIYKKGWLGLLFVLKIVKELTQTRE